MITVTILNASLCQGISAPCCSAHKVTLRFASSVKVDLQITTLKSSLCVPLGLGISVGKFSLASLSCKKPSADLRTGWSGSCSCCGLAGPGVALTLDWMLEAGM